MNRRLGDVDSMACMINKPKGPGPNMAMVLPGVMSLVRMAREAVVHSSKTAASLSGTNSGIWKSMAWSAAMYSAKHPGESMPI